MIIGIGTDLVAISRIKDMLDKFGDKFAQRILSDSEYTEYKKAPQPPKGGAYFLAKRFAAKEATAKALGTGFANGISHRDISVTNNSAGKPLLQFTNQALELQKKLGVNQLHLSISDEKEMVVAFVVLTK